MANPSSPCGFNLSYSGHTTFQMLCVHVSLTQPGLPPRGLTNISPVHALADLWGTPLPSGPSRFHPSVKVTSSKPGSQSASFLIPHGHSRVLHCFLTLSLAFPFGWELLDCRATFPASLLSSMPQTKASSSMLRESPRCSSWPSLPNGHCPCT